MWAAIGMIAIIATIYLTFDGIANNDDMPAFKVCVAICLAVICGFGIGFALKGADDLTPLYGHIDHSKTRTLEENGETTDLYITIDGTEYHFELKEETK